MVVGDGSVVVEGVIVVVTIVVYSGYNGDIFGGSRRW